jgi:aminoglycoside 2''-phosphotransferase
MMTGDKNGLDLESIRAEITRLAPQFQGEPVARLGEGMDSLAVSVGRTFVFRFAKHAEAAAGLRREIALLPRLAPRLRLRVPEIRFVGEHSVSRFPFIGYRLIEGEPLHRTLYEGLTEETRVGLLGELADFLRSVHAFPTHEAMACGVGPHEERAGYLEDLRRARAAVFPRLGQRVRLALESELVMFLDDDANFANSPTLLHADLWPEHVLFTTSAGRLAGVIDFGDVSIGDPDYDLAFLAQRLGPAFLSALLRHHPHAEPARLARKVRSIALFNAIEDVFIGLDRGDGSLVESARADLIEQSVSVRSVRR